MLSRCTVDPTARESPTVALLRALGLGPEHAADVAAVPRSYQPHAERTAEADDAGERLVAGWAGGRAGGTS